MSSESQTRKDVTIQTNARGSRGFQNNASNWRDKREQTSFQANKSILEIKHRGHLYEIDLINSDEGSGFWWIFVTELLHPSPKSIRTAQVNVKKLGIDSSPKSCRQCIALLATDCRIHSENTVRWLGFPFIYLEIPVRLLEVPAECRSFRRQRPVSGRVGGRQRDNAYLDEDVLLTFECMTVGLRWNSMLLLKNKKCRLSGSLFDRTSAGTWYTECLECYMHRGNRISTRLLPKQFAREIIDIRLSLSYWW